TEQLERQGNEQDQESDCDPFAWRHKGQLMRSEQKIEKHKNNNHIKSGKTEVIAVQCKDDRQLRSCKPISAARTHLGIRQCRVNKKNDDRANQNRKNECRFFHIEFLRADAIKLVETNRGAIQPEGKQMGNQKTEDEERVNHETRI